VVIQPTNTPSLTKPFSEKQLCKVRRLDEECRKHVRGGLLEAGDASDLIKRLLEVGVRKVTAGNHIK
jgi:hypothetical protein